MVDRLEAGFNMEWTPYAKPKSQAHKPIESLATAAKPHVHPLHSWQPPCSSKLGRRVAPGFRFHISGSIPEFMWLEGWERGKIGTPPTPVKGSPDSAIQPIGGSHPQFRRLPPQDTTFQPEEFPCWLAARNDLPGVGNEPEGDSP